MTCVGRARARRVQASRLAESFAGGSVALTFSLARGGTRARGEGVADLWDPVTTPEGIIDRANLFFSSQALLTANRLGLFAALPGESRKEAKELARELDLDPRA